LVPIVRRLTGLPQEHRKHPPQQGSVSRAHTIARTSGKRQVQFAALPDAAGREPAAIHGVKHPGKNGRVKPPARPPATRAPPAWHPDCPPRGGLASDGPPASWLPRSCRPATSRNAHEKGVCTSCHKTSFPMVYQDWLTSDRYFLHRQRGNVHFTFFGPWESPTWGFVGPCETCTGV